MKINWKPFCLISYKPDLGTEDGKTIYGKARWFFVTIREDERDNQGVLEHELEHVKQFWSLGIFHGLLLWVPQYKAWTEKKAYEKQRGA
jgi:hypothetical protein